jgi:metal-sulfur cluster biosynthetic enzyme
VKNTPLKSLEEATEEVRRVLNAITDPCSIAAGAPAGMIDMGLVREVSLQPMSQHGFHVRVRISVTHPFCLLAGVFLNEVQKRLRCLPHIEVVDASIDTSTMWSPNMMTPEYRAQVAAVRRKRLPEAAMNGEGS